MRRGTQANGDKEEDEDEEKNKDESARKRNCFVDGRGWEGKRGKREREVET